MDQRKNKYYSMWILLASVFVAYSAYAQVVEPVPILPGEKAQTDISKVFNPTQVGSAAATFVNPIAACVQLYAGGVWRFC